MTRMWIVVGDATTCGGRVISGSPFTDIDGKGIARLGDKATCPTHKGVFAIIDGDPTTIIDGQPVALHGSSLACGCKVLAVQQVQVFFDASDDARSKAGSCAGALLMVADAFDAGGAFDEAFVLKCEDTGELLANRRYRIVRDSGAVEDGVTSSEGQTHIVRSVMPESLQIEIEVDAA